MTLHFRITKVTDKKTEPGKEIVSFRTEYANAKVSLRPLGFLSLSEEDLKKDIIKLIETYFKDGS